MRARVFLSVVVSCGFAVCSAQPVDQRLLDSLKWREIGPWRGGRSCAVSGVPGKPKEFFMGTCGGGLWKSLDEGETWRCVSDGFFRTGSVGAVEVSQSNPGTVYVGMGETEIRGNISHGDGVYRSDDGGATWRHLGLTETQSIARVRVHPKNPDIAWVAALGHVYGQNAQRGVFKTVDGGRTWRRTLFVSEKAGACDLSIDQKNPDVMYASTWEAWRTPFTMNSGGPGSKVFKSTDGGESWTDISKNQGLPKGVLGKVGISVSPVDPNRVYADIEAADGGVYVSDDAGATWTRTNFDPNYRQRPWYYTRIYADPVDKDTVYVTNVSFGKSTDGGKTFRSGSARHSDHHDIWIDPADNRRVVMANDGGASVTVDGGRGWSEQDFPTAQFYHVSLDNAYPYNVLAAQQDNSTVRIASRTFGAGITREDWTSTAGGESGYVAALPRDPDIVFGGSYGGTMDMQNHRTNVGRSVDPWPDNPMGHGAEGLTHRFQWTYPIVFGRVDRDNLYTGSQFVMRSKDLGTSWEVISPDLTTNDKSKQGPSGGPITKDNTSVEYYCTVFTIAPSPRSADVIWAGTDDGLVWVTRDGGKNWSNVTPKGMPAFPVISMIEASAFGDGTAYVAVDNHENDDLRPYSYVTKDFGQTWRLMNKGLPVDSCVRVVREDTEKQGLLYAGLETGIWVSFDDGGNWQPLQSNLPVVPVHDLAVRDDELVAATHGRSLWILNDLCVVRQAVGKDVGKVIAFDTARGFAGRGGSPGVGDVGKNPSFGWTMKLWSPSEQENCVVEIKDKDGLVVGTSTVRRLTKGMNEFNLSVRYPGYSGFPGLRFWGAGGSGSVAAAPGRYQVSIKVGDETVTAVGNLGSNPAAGATDEELVAKYELSKKIAEATGVANASVLRCRAWRAAIGESFTGGSLEAAGTKASEAVQEIEDALYQGKAQSGQDLLNFPIRLNNRLAALFGYVNGSSFGPTKGAYDVFAILKFDLDMLTKRLDEWEKTEVPKLNAMLKAAGKDELSPKSGQGGTDLGRLSWALARALG